MTSESSLPIHGLHALACCERLFYLENVEHLRVADERVFAGRRLHVELERKEDEGEVLTMTLESERWGLVGKADCIRRRDRANALLSFGYALLMKDVLNAILVVGLDPSLGFYHQPRSQAHPLALDLMKLFREPLVDLPVIASINILMNGGDPRNHLDKRSWRRDLSSTL